MNYEPSVSAVLSFCTRATSKVAISTRLILLFIAITFLSSGCSNSNERANKLFVQAISTLEGMKDSETSTKADKLAAWQKTSDILDKIIKDFPGSEIAVQLVQNKAIVDGKSLSEFRAIPERMKEKECMNRLRFIALSASVWANDHNDTLPRSYSELVHAVVDDTKTEDYRFVVKNLFCPKTVAFVPKKGTNENVIPPEEIERNGYTAVQFGLKKEDANETKTWLRCPNCSHELHVDGSVHKK